MRTYKGFVQELDANDVFVFGANTQGFHGAGAAGYATFGVPGNRWREFDYGSRPFGWKGRWTEKGRTGFMTGTAGMSYGLITVTKPGARRSISRDQLTANIKELYDFAKNRTDLTFYVAQTADGGYNGYSGLEMASFYVKAGALPENMVFDNNFAKLINDLIRDKK